MAQTETTAANDDRLLPELVKQLLVVHEQIPAIKTTDFIDLIEHVIVIFDKLGSVLMFAKSDMQAKCSELRKIADTCPTVKDVYEADKKAGCVTKKGSAARGLYRLTGVLSFLKLLLQKLLEDPECSTKDAASFAYEEALAPAHTFIIKAAVRTGMIMLPYRNVFMQSIGETDETAWEPATSLVKHAQPVIDSIWGMYEEKMPVG